MSQPDPDIPRREIIEAYNYKLVRWSEFLAADDHAPIAGYHARFAEVMAPMPTGEWVIYDPLDNEWGWFLIGDDPEALVRETIEQRIPDEGEDNAG